MSEKAKEGVPALQNEDVTGMTEEKQEEVIKKSGRAPSTAAAAAAAEFYREQGQQAKGGPTPGDRSKR